jgi:hypothetical protein
VTRARRTHDTTVTMVLGLADTQAVIWQGSEWVSHPLHWVLVARHVSYSVACQGRWRMAEATGVLL